MVTALLTLDLECSHCGTRPNVRVTVAFLDLVRGADPDHVLGTWACQGPRCSTRVPITVGMIQRATAPALTEGITSA